MPESMPPVGAAGLATGSLCVHVQGHRLDLLYDQIARPTLYSLFLANSLEGGPGVVRACDVGTGGGILSIALALMGVQEVLAFDRSEVACELAEANARRNGVADKVRVELADVGGLTLDAPCDLVVSNPPTMPGRPGVPALASGGGAAGLNFLTALLAGLPSWLSPSGRAQIVISSLAEPAGRFGPCEEAGLEATPVATMLAPFRSFYADAYDREELDAFLARGLALSDEGGAGGSLYEILTIYTLARRPGARSRMG